MSHTTPSRMKTLAGQSSRQWHSARCPRLAARTNPQARNPQPPEIVPRAIDRPELVTEPGNALSILPRVIDQPSTVFDTARACVPRRLASDRNPSELIA